jgi:5-formyltetrahydrofolate cyclo-ligase
MTPDLAARKEAARRAARALRAGLDPHRGAALAAHVLAEWPMRPGSSVAAFWPMRDEIDIVPLLHALADRGHRIGLPRTPPRGEALRFHHWQPGDALEAGAMGTRQPAASAALLLPDLFLIPLLAFDQVGRRLGYGGGYYDRTLPLHPRARRLGCAHAAQRLDEVPADDHDARLDAVATDQGILLCEPPRMLPHP